MLAFKLVQAADFAIRVVGEDEADFKQGKISVGSPIARALIAKEEGDVVAVKTPGGVIEYEIVEVRHV